MISDSLFNQIQTGREGLNQGFSMGLPKLESVIDGVMQGIYTLIFSGSGIGIIKYFAVYIRNYTEN